MSLNQFLKDIEEENRKELGAPEYLPIHLLNSFREEDMKEKEVEDFIFF